MSAVLYESDALRIEREGARTHIFDLIGNETYTFTAKRVKKSGADRAKTARETANTETVTIKTVYDLIIVTEKSSGKTLYVRGAS